MAISKPTTLICTLGGQPQVVTFALDALLARQIAITHLFVLHFAAANGRTRQALQTLTTALQDERYRERPFHFHPYPLRAGHSILNDIRDEADANAAWEAINQLIIHLKNERHTLHVCISGGRRMLGLLTMSAAMLHFGHQDVLWHMYTPDQLRQTANEGAIMHLPPEAGFHLIQVPMMPWGSYFPALRQLVRPSPNHSDVLAQPRHLLDTAEEARCQRVFRQLTDRQRDVLLAFTQEFTPQQVAAKLNISIKTVDSHKTIILTECRQAWDLPEETWLDYHFLVEKFSLFLAQQP